MENDTSSTTATTTAAAAATAPVVAGAGVAQKRQRSGESDAERERESASESETATVRRPRRKRLRATATPALQDRDRPVSRRLSFTESDTERDSETEREREKESDGVTPSLSQSSAAAHSDRERETGTHAQLSPKRTRSRLSYGHALPRSLSSSASSASSVVGERDTQAHTLTRAHTEPHKVSESAPSATHTLTQTQTQPLRESVSLTLPARTTQSVHTTQQSAPPLKALSTQLTHTQQEKPTQPTQLTQPVRTTSLSVPVSVSVSVPATQRIAPTQPLPLPQTAAVTVPPLPPVPVPVAQNDTLPHTDTPAVSHTETESEETHTERVSHHLRSLCVSLVLFVALCLSLYTHNPAHNTHQAGSLTHTHTQPHAHSPSAHLLAPLLWGESKPHTHDTRTHTEALNLTLAQARAEALTAHNALSQCDDHLLVALRRAAEVREEVHAVTTAVPSEKNITRTQPHTDSQPHTHTHEPVTHTETVSLSLGWLSELHDELSQLERALDSTPSDNETTLLTERQSQRERVVEALNRVDVHVTEISVDPHTGTGALTEALVEATQDAHTSLQGASARVEAFGESVARESERLRESVSDEHTLIETVSHTLAHAQRETLALSERVGDENITHTETDPPSHKLTAQEAQAWLGAHTHTLSVESAHWQRERERCEDDTTQLALAAAHNEEDSLAHDILLQDTLTNRNTEPLSHTEDVSETETVEHSENSESKSVSDDVRDTEEVRESDVWSEAAQQLVHAYLEERAHDALTQALSQTLSLKDIDSHTHVHEDVHSAGTRSDEETHTHTSSHIPSPVSHVTQQHTHTGEADFAVSPRGGRVVSASRCLTHADVRALTDTQAHKDTESSSSHNAPAQVSLFPQKIVRETQSLVRSLSHTLSQSLSRCVSPASVITQHISRPGQCYALHGKTGELVISVHSPIGLEAVVLTHFVSRSPTLVGPLSHREKAESAVRVFALSVTTEDGAEHALHTTFSYNVSAAEGVQSDGSFVWRERLTATQRAHTQSNGEGEFISQRFPVAHLLPRSHNTDHTLTQAQTQSVRSVRVSVRDNHGAPYTCIYGVGLVGVLRERE